MEAKVEIVKRDTIPPIFEVEQDGEVHCLGELRDFRWSESLRKFMADAAGFSVSWVFLREKEVLQPHVHPVLSMMVIYAGRGDMLGDLRCPLEQGQVVVVPAGCQHGFLGGRGGLAALSIQFSGGLYTQPERPRVVFMEGRHSLITLRAHSERRRSDFLRSSVFELLADDCLREPAKAESLRTVTESWIYGVDRVLASWKATCRNPSFRPRSTDLLERTSGRPLERPILRDTLIEAAMSWFDYQMFVLDDAEKMAILALVLSNSLGAYAESAPAALKARTRLEETVRELRHCFSDRADELLQDETPSTYMRLEKIVDEAWDMTEMLTGRLAKIVREGP